jgi:hypothetical protein
MGKDATTPPHAKGAAKITPKDKNELKAERESQAAPISKPGGFDNDPKDPTNPNEMRERTLKKLHRRGPPT